MSKRREVDQVTGVETTGHEWDGVKELNKPLPRWWLLTFYATIIWGVGYMIAYPAWPTLSGYTKGVIGYSQRATVAEQMQDAAKAQGVFREQLERASLNAIKSNQDLLRFAMAGGQASFHTNCAPCHGRGGQGFPGYPNLNDDDWLWGGTLEEIQKSIMVGIRSEHKETRSVAMPRYGIDNMLTPEQIDEAAEYVLSLSAKSTDSASAGRGAKTFKDQCAACHGDDGKGKIDQGTPDLTDAIWLYGGTKNAVVDSIRTGRGGAMPFWQGRLDPVTIKALAIYVHSLGGGK